MEAGGDTDEDDEPISEGTIHRLLRIVPINEASISAFLNLDDTLRKQSADGVDLYDHHRRFVKAADPHIYAAQSAIGPYTPSNNSGSDAERSTPELEDHTVYNKATQCFELSVQCPPRTPTLGWIMGRKHDIVDLVIPDPTKRRVHSAHCVIQFSDNGQLQVRALQGGVTLDDVTLVTGTTHVLHRPIHRLDIRNHAYSLSCVVAEQAREPHEIAKHRYFRQYLPSLGTPHNLASASPSLRDQYINKDWKISAGQAIGTGAGTYATGTTFVQVVTHTKRGAVRALKERRRADSKAAESIKKTERTYSRIKSLLQNDPSRNHIEHLTDVLYSDRECGWVPGIKDKVFHLFSPLGNGTFYDFFISRKFSHHSMLNKQHLYFQVIMGLASLHRCHVLHRDIKPENLVVCLTDPPKAVIIDFDQARFLDDCHKGIDPTPGRGGTIGYLAPEQENEDYGQAGLYSYPVDIFAMGLVGIDIFADNRRPSWPRSSRTPNPFRTPITELAKDSIAKLNVLLQYLLSKNRGSLEYLLGKMLSIDPSQRITAEDICTNEPMVRTFVEEQLMRHERESRSDELVGSKRRHIQD